MRPSIQTMFDSTIRIWRPTATIDVVGMEERTLAPIDVVGAKVNRSHAPEAMIADALAPVGGIRWYGLSTIDVQLRDICQVVSGPDQGRTWEVNEPPVRPRGHHTQVDCIEWNGALPPLSES